MKRRRRTGSLRYKQSSPVSPIGETRDEQKARAHAHQTMVIAVVRALVFARDPSCRYCGAKGRPDDHMHEVKSRARLRGRPPEEIFSLENCLRLCDADHRKVTLHELWIVVLDLVAGCNGRVEFSSSRSF